MGSAMVNQYIDSITISVNTAATQNGDGNWVEGSSTDYTFDCRIEPNGQGDKIRGEDGVLMDFDFMCYLPKTTTLITAGSEFTVTSLNNGEITGNIKRASNGQLNSRLWL